MREVFLWAAVAEVAVIALLLVRLAIGPSAPDRIIALNATSTQATLAVLCFAAYADRTSYLDVAIWMASFSYLGTLVWARLVERELL